VEVDDERVAVLILVLEQFELQLVGALGLDKGCKVFNRFGLLILDFLFDSSVEFLDFLVLLALTECVREDLVLFELGHEAVKDGLGPTDGTR